MLDRRSGFDSPRKYGRTVTCFYCWRLRPGGYLQVCQLTPPTSRVFVFSLLCLSYIVFAADASLIEVFSYLYLFRPLVGLISVLIIQ